MERTERSAAERAGAAKRTACVLRCACASAAKTAEAQKARLEIRLEAFSRCALLCDHLGGVAWRIRRDDSKRRHQCAVFRSEQQCCVHNLARGERRHELGYEREQRRHGFRDEHQDIAAKLTPSVVCIQNYQVTQNYGLCRPIRRTAAFPRRAKVPASS